MKTATLLSVDDIQPVSEPIGQCSEDDDGRACVEEEQERMCPETTTDTIIYHYPLLLIFPLFSNLSSAPKSDDDESRLLPVCFCIDCARDWVSQDRQHREEVARANDEKGDEVRREGRS